jgi:hypothetical protein
MIRELRPHEPADGRHLVIGAREGPRCRIARIAGEVRARDGFRAQSARHQLGGNQCAKLQIHGHRQPRARQLPRSRRGPCV